MKQGGKRTGAGRPKTGPKVKKYTITLPKKIAAELEYHAATVNLTPNKFITNFLKDEVNKNGWYDITNSLNHKEIKL